jgi:hypothetical protein
VTNGATSGTGAFGTMLASPATTTPALAAMPPSFRGTLMAASLPLGTLMTAGMPLAEPATSPANCFVQPAGDAVVTVEPTGQMAQPMTMTAALAPPLLRTPTTLSGDQAVTPTPILRSATVAALQAAAPATPLRSTQPSVLHVVAAPADPAMPAMAAPEPDMTQSMMADVRPGPTKSILPTAASPSSVTLPVATPTAGPSVMTSQVGPAFRAVSTVSVSTVQPSMMDVPQPPATTEPVLSEPQAQAPVSPLAPRPQLQTPPDQPEDGAAAVPVDAAPPVTARTNPIQRASLPADAAPVVSGDDGVTPRPMATSKPAIASRPMVPITGAAPMPVTLASLETVAPVVAKAATTGKAAAGDAAPAEEQPATDGDDTVAPAPIAIPGLIAAAVPVPVPPPVTGSGQADAASAPATGQEGGRHQATAPAAAAPAAVIPPAAGAVPADRADPKPVAAASAAAPTIAGGLRAVRDEATSADAKPATAVRTAVPDAPAFANLVEQKAAPVATAPAAQPTPMPEARVPAEPGRLGHGMAVAIARHTAEGGGEALTVRLNPAEFGRIDVTLSFDDRGTLRAVMAAETPAALDLLRRDSADLGRALNDAGMRTDAQSFRFDTKQGGADAGGQGAPGGHRWQPGATPRAAATAMNETVQPEYRPLRTRGGVDLMA